MPFDGGAPWTFKVRRSGDGWQEDRTTPLTPGAAPVAEARAFVVDESVKYADETGWREARAPTWLWSVVTTSVTVFMIHRRRTAEAAHAILGSARGVLVSDRHGAYNWWPNAPHPWVSG